MNQLAMLRADFRRMVAALPWLDAWNREDCFVPPFGIRGAEFPAPEPGKIVLFRPNEGSLEEFIRKNHRKNVITAVRHDELRPGELEKALKFNPDTPVILGSGEKKMLYHIDYFIEVLAEYPNLFLSTANLCNFQLFADAELGKYQERLLWGSLAPLHDVYASIGMLVLSALPWETKCKIAGNNLRKLLGKPEVKTPEVIDFQPIEPFIIDAHGHSAVKKGELPMRTADLNFHSPSDWLEALTQSRVKKFIITPMIALNDAKTTARQAMLQLIKYGEGRFYYFDTFDARYSEICEAKLHTSLKDPFCVGIKIHPTFHHTDGADLRYRKAWELAALYEKAIMTHSWAPVAHNPEQGFSAPGRFAGHVAAFPQVKFVLGHAGGRPGTFEETVRLCNQYENVFVDLSGDYFHDGLAEKLKAAIGIKKILYASDADWIDPAAEQGILLGSKFSDGDLERIFTKNAEDVYF